MNDETMAWHAIHLDPSGSGYHPHSTKNCSSRRRRRRNASSEGNHRHEDIEGSPTSPDEMKCSVPRRRRCRAVPVIPLPFEGTVTSNCNERIEKSPSDCTSIASDEMVAMPPLERGRSNSRCVPSFSSFHSDATAPFELLDHAVPRSDDSVVLSHESMDEPPSSQEDSDADSFDIEKMHAPVTSLSHQPQHRFRRHSQPLNLPEYFLGEEGHPVDMRVESSHGAAHLAVATLLREFDSAFVRRSDGRWSYAVLAERMIGTTMEHSKLRFVVDCEGSTKIVSYRKWARAVRLVREPVEANAMLREQGKLIVGRARPEAMPRDLADPH